MSLGLEMDESSGNERGGRRIRNGVRCLLLRRSRRRAHSEPPKAKRHERDRDTSFSPKTAKPRKIAREERYKTSRNSTSDSGFLSLESNGIELSDMTADDRTVRDENTVIHYGTFRSETVSDDELTTREYREFSSHFDEEIVDLNENFDDISYENKKDNDPESFSVNSSSICFRCTCLPRLFGGRTRTRSRVSRIESSAASSSYFDYREDKLLKYLRDNDTTSSASDDTRCFLNVLYNEHKCADPRNCNRKKLASLNAHLRNLMDCMPKSFCDCESTTNWDNSEPERAGYLTHRRNAVCETSEDTRTKFYEALCTFMTLKALVRYDLL